MGRFVLLGMYIVAYGLMGWVLLRIARNVENASKWKFEDGEKKLSECEITPEDLKVPYMVFEEKHGIVGERDDTKESVK